MRECYIYDLDICIDPALRGKTVQVYDLTRGASLGSAIEIANTFWLRLKGLLGRRRLNPGEGLLLAPCSSVHTWWMKMEIDVLFISREGVVIKAFSRVAPGNFIPLVKETRYVLELPAGTAAAVGVETGDEVALVYDGLEMTHNNSRI